MEIDYLIQELEMRGLSYLICILDKKQDASYILSWYRFW